VAFGVLPLGLILFVADATGSLSAAGAASGAWGLASALHPLRGRLVDRWGPRALLGLLVCFVAGLAILVVVGEVTGAPAPVIVTAALVGLVIPPIGPFARAVWGAAYRRQPERLQAAYAADSTLDEATLVAGPVLVGAIVLLASPAAAVLVAAGVMLAAGAATALAPLARVLRAGRGDGDAAETAEPGQSSARDLRLALGALAGIAVALGALEITAPAFATARDAPASAGVLAAALSVGGVAAGLLYGVHGGRGALTRRLAFWAALYTVALAPLLIADSLWALGLLLIVPGLALGPLWIVLLTFVAAATPAGHGTRVFGWVVAINNGGVAVGVAVGGVLVEDHGSSSGFALALAAAAAGASLAAVTAGVAARASKTLSAPEPST
jgi:MFS family permease